MMVASGKLFETDDFMLKWVFLATDGNTYLTGFGRRETAEAYGRSNGYDVDSPIKITMAKLRGAQSARQDTFSTNSAIPQYDPNAGAGVADRKAPMRRSK